MNRAWAAALTLVLAVGGPVSAQIPTPAQAQALLRDNPQLARQRLLESGLSEAEIRAQLTSAGYPADALDAFLSGAPIDPTTAFDADAIAGLQILGVATATADGLELVPLTTGLQPLMGGDSAAASGVFGHGVFARATSQFQPLLFGPVSADYRVGPGDSMVLVLTGEVEDLTEVVVTREGFIVVPDVGQINVANLTVDQLRSVLRQRLARAYSGIERGSTTFDVTITRLRTNQIYVTGNVQQPGAYQLASVATVTNALYAAGGPTEVGNLRRVEVRRRSGEDAVLDLYPYLLRGDVSQDIVLQQGDVVFVAPHDRRVRLVGAVQRPSVYDLSETDDLFDVLSAAGGFAPEADRRRVTIHRVVRPVDRGPGLSDRMAIDLGLTPSRDASAVTHVGGVLIPPVGLQDGDSIVIDQSPALADGYYVTIAGMVAAPDTFPWREGMSIRELMSLARGPIVGADLREAEVSRLPDDRVSGELAERLSVPLDSSYLSQRDPAGRYVGAPGVPFPPAGSTPEFVLQPFDQVMIRRQPDFEMPTTVTITGEVPVPGQYTLLSKSDRVTDLIGRAHGILPTGYPQGARLHRTIENLGRIDLDLPAALAAPESADDLTLQPGDSLHIPVYSPTVVVRGAVNSPVTVLYREGEDYDYYIANAGGYRNDADRGRSAVRYANGLAQTRSKFLFWASYPTPGPGSVITVPAKDPADRVDTRGLIADLVAIVGSIATVIVVVSR